MKRRRITTGAKQAVTLKYRSSRYTLAPGDAGIERTLQWMRGLVQGREGAANPNVRAQALDMVRAAGNNDFLAQIQLVFAWVKANIEFRGEFKETLQSPLVTLEVRAGDCDDHSSLNAALLGSLGFRTRFTTVAADPSEPQAFTHVFCEVYERTSQRWLAMDTTVAQSTVGWRPPAIFREQHWHAMGTLTLGETNSPADVQSSVQSAAVDAIHKITDASSTALANRIQYGSNATTGGVQYRDGQITGAVNVSPAMLFAGAAGLIALVALTHRGRA